MLERDKATITIATSCCYIFMTVIDFMDHA